MPLTFQVGTQRQIKYRLGELMLYVAKESVDDETLGSTKLNKILWWADMRSFALLGKPITGSAYRRERYGPTPDQWRRVRESLLEEGAAKFVKIESGEYTQHRLQPLRPPDLSKFSKRQVEIVNRVIAEVRDMDARMVTEKSHGLAWKLTGPNKRIPYEAVYLSDEPLTENDIEWAEITAEFLDFYYPAHPNS